MAKFPSVKNKVTPTSEVVENKVAEGVVNNGEMQGEKEEVKAEVKVVDVPQERPAPTTAKVVPNKNFRGYYGNRWYDFVDGVEAEVPVGLVFELREQGNID